MMLLITNKLKKIELNCDKRIQTAFVLGNGCELNWLGISDPVEANFFTITERVICCFFSFLRVRFRGEI